MRTLLDDRCFLGCFNGHQSIGIPSFSSAAIFNLSILVSRGTLLECSKRTRSPPFYNVFVHIASLLNGFIKSSNSSLKRAKASLDFKNNFTASMFNCTVGYLSLSSSLESLEASLMVLVVKAGVSSDSRFIVGFPICC